MTKYILHGGFTKEDNESNRSFFSEFLKDVPNNGTILFVYFAARTKEEIPEKFSAHTAMCRRAAEGKQLNFLIATEENFIKEIDQASAIFFNGGSTNKLLRILKNYPNLKSVLSGKTIAGSSAGAYILGMFGASHSEETVREGLGFVPLRVVCHYGSSKLPPNMASVANLEKMAQEYELVILEDYEWRMFEV